MTTPSGPLIYFHSHPLSNHQKGELLFLSRKWWSWAFQLFVIFHYSFWLDSSLCVRASWIYFKLITVPYPYSTRHPTIYPNIEVQKLFNDFDSMLLSSLSNNCRKVDSFTPIFYRMNDILKYMHYTQFMQQVLNLSYFISLSDLC